MSLSLSGLGAQPLTSAASSSPATSYSSLAELRGRSRVTALVFTSKRTVFSLIVTVWPCGEDGMRAAESGRGSDSAIVH